LLLIFCWILGGFWARHSELLQEWRAPGS